MLNSRRLIKAAAGAMAVCLILSILAVHGQAQGVREQVVRLHILAHSDSTEDQTLKLQVRDAVTEAAHGWLDGNENSAEALATVREQLPRLEAVARQTVAEAGADYPVAVTLERVYFTTREYDTFTLPAGMYDAVQITLGDGRGQNWWCVVYPPLCAGSATDLSTLEENQQDLVTGGEGYRAKFWLIEWLQSLLQIFQF